MNRISSGDAAHRILTRQVYTNGELDFPTLIRLVDAAHTEECPNCRAISLAVGEIIVGHFARHPEPMQLESCKSLQTKIIFPSTPIAISLKMAKLLTAYFPAASNGPYSIFRVQPEEILNQNDKITIRCGLDFSKMEISDKLISSIVAIFPHLAMLDFSNCTQVTDKSLKLLSGIQLLDRLALQGCRDITDQGISEMTPLKNVWELNIKDTSTTDASIASIIRIFPKLTLLHADDSQFTKEGIQSLKAANLNPCF